MRPQIEYGLLLKLLMLPFKEVSVIEESLEWDRRVILLLWEFELFIRLILNYIISVKPI